MSTKTKHKSPRAAVLAPFDKTRVLHLKAECIKIQPTESPGQVFFLTQTRTF